MLSNLGFAPVAQPVEHVLGKDEVTGSKPVGGFFIIEKPENPFKD